MKLPAEKDLRKVRRGSHGYCTDANSQITLTEWFDNKYIQIISNYCGPEATTKVKRWNRQTYIKIDCPTAV